MDEQDNTQLLESDLNDFRPMPRNLFVRRVEKEHLSGSNDQRMPTRYATQPEQFQILTETRQRHPLHSTSRCSGPVESAQTSELQEQTRVLEKAMERILSCLIPDDPLIPLLNRGEQPAEMATRNSLALSNIVVPTRPRGSGKSNPKPTLSKHNKELMKKNADLKRQLKDVQRSIDALRTEPYQEGFKIPHLETYDGSGDLNEHLHTYQRSSTGSRDHILHYMIPHDQTEASIVTIIVEWENAPITFNLADYKRSDGEPDIMMPHANPFVATVHIGNHNVNKVFINTGSSPDIMYWGCSQKMQLNPTSLKKYEGPIYGFDYQPVLVEGIITLPIYVGAEPWFKMASVNFLVVKIESAFNAIIGKATLCELKAVISQPQLCMKFPTPQGVGVLKRNKKVDRTCYHDIFKKVELATAPKASALEVSRPRQPGKFLGYVVSKKGIEVNPDKVQVMQQMEPPKSVKDVQRLTDCLGALYRFIAKSTEKCLPFFKALREPKNFQWTDECQWDFDELKQYLASPPLLSKPIEGKKLYLYLGITDEAISSFLLRE
ncbi:hypothetical protein SLEP1_g56529 [Rubroshorea leprosula]|uniref:Reverse transcriptase/retrotransposon-derived protein RNase H-like domain-containing protein n=1 Tax=Rubroshorea leprosula TaxID=152421 RepID=A0AAV5MKY1_9ROSI|nr:hypothetical protein SLEP1_g56529 [Rubroshorea leprosula]